MWPQYILFRMERKIYNHVKHGMILPAIVFLYKKMPNES